MIEQRAVNDAQNMLLKLLDIQKKQGTFSKATLDEKVKDSVKLFCEQQQKTPWYKLTQKAAPKIEFDPGYLVQIKPALNIQLDDHIKLQNLESTCIKLKAELERLLATNVLVKL